MSSITLIAKSNLPTPWGNFTLIGFQESATGKEHAALMMGDLTTDEPALARIHSECLTGDALFSLRCDCGFQLQAAMQRIAELQRGIILYVRQEGRGIGLLNKIHAYHLQDQGADTVEANVALGFAPDQRNYRICADMLKVLDVESIELMTNNPQKIKAMQNFGIQVTQRVAIEEGRNPHNQFYLSTKANKLGHLMTDNTCCSKSKS